MRIIVAHYDENKIISFELDPSDLIEDVKSLIEVETLITTDKQELYFNGRKLDDSKTISFYNIQDNDILQFSLRRSPQQRVQQTSQRFGGSFDPLDIEFQRRLENKIAEENLSHNLQNAIEYNPEAFAPITMLYVNCEVNKTPLKAFVDSGAQMTVMSVSCAERCGIMRLLDRKWAGMAVGVGTAKILGRIHAAMIKIGDSYFYSSFTVLDDQNMDFLLGLDFLRKHQCCVDLKDKVLRIGNEAINFLEEKDIPERIKPMNEITSSNSNQPIVIQSESSINISNSNSISNSSISTNQPLNQTQSFPESVIENLMSITGHSREVVIESLAMSGGDPNVAAANLSFD